MRRGGNAIDAAIAANAALGLMEPTGNGIGGDLYAIVWDAESEQLYGLNASGRSPRSLTLDWFLDQGYEKIPPYGPLPVSVPGAVDGWFELHGRFGKIPMADVLQPTPARALAATLDLADRPGDGDRLPELWHWLYFLPAAPASTLGRDGHPARGGGRPRVVVARQGGLQFA